MNPIMNTSILFINNLLNINALSVKRKDHSLFLPSPYVTESENIAIQTLIEKAPPYFIYYLVDQCLLYYCIVLIDENAVLLGPYREIDMTLHKARKNLTLLQKEPDFFPQYLAYYNSVPRLTKGSVKMAAHTLAVAMDLDTKDLMEKTINISQYINQIPQLETYHSISQNELEAAQKLPVLYMNQIERGNYMGAISLYKEIMMRIPRHQHFIYINTIEGLSTIRTLTQIAAQKAGVPLHSIHEIIEKFKQKSRLVASREEAVNLVTHMVNDICFLIQKQNISRYSYDIRLALNYIHKNLPNTLSVSSIAVETGLSVSRLSTKFRQETGLPIMTYINQKRMEEAASLLSLTNMDIQEISTQIGILDSNYFSRAFKKQYHQSPTDYRNRFVL